MEKLWFDLKQAGRLLSKRPVLVLVSTVIMGLGIGSSTAIFSLVNGILLRDLPFQGPDRLVLIRREVQTGERSIPTTSMDYANWRDGSQLLDSIGAYTSREFEVSLSESDDAEPMQGAETTPSLFTTLGVSPAIGRLFDSDEGENDAAVVVLSDEFWRQRFAGDPDVLGQRMTIQGTPHTVVGVLPPGLEFPLVSLFYTPRDYEAFTLPAPGSGGPGRRQVRYTLALLTVIGRLKPGVTAEQLTSELSSIKDERLVMMGPLGVAGEPRTTVQNLTESIVGKFRPALWILSGAVAFLLLVACANVASLLLARAVERRRETAVRTALGAGPWRLARHLLSESFLLGSFGGLLGVGLAFLAVRLILASSPIEIPRSDNVGIDGWVLFFAVVASVATSLIFGLAPVLQSRRPDLTRSLKEGGTEASGSLRIGRGNWVRLGLVVAEVTFSLVLLVGAGLLTNSFLKLVLLEPGFNPNNVMVVQSRSTQGLRAGMGNPATLSRGYEQMLEEVRAIPGVESAAVTSSVAPDSQLTRVSYEIENVIYRDDSERPTALQLHCSDGYFETLRQPLIAGRTFSNEDFILKNVAVVNELVAGSLPGDPLGQQLVVSDQAYQIIGVVANAYQKGLETDPDPIIYLPDRSGVVEMSPAPGQRMVMVRNMTLILRSFQEPMALAGAVQSRLENLNRRVQSMELLDQTIWQSIAQPRFYSILFAVFAAVALLLAATGIFGLVSYAVQQSTREIGIRMALGAGRTRILHSLLGQGLAIASVGVVLGLAGAAGLARFLESLLVRVPTSDPITFLVVGLLFLIVAAVACFIPARRATRINPMEAVRTE